MKTYRKYLAAVAFLGLTLALPCRSAAAPGQQTLHLKFMGLTGQVTFDSFDVSGCVETLVFLQAIDGRIKLIRRPEVTSNASVFIGQFDNCTFTQLLAAFGSATLPDIAFQIDKQLTSATLNTTIEVFDSVSNTSFPVDLSVNWTGTGQSVNEKDHFMLRVPGFRVNATFAGSFRPATASGSVTAGATNFSPGPGGLPELDSVTIGELDVFH